MLGRLAERGAQAMRVLLVEASGAPADLVAAHGSRATPYSAFLSPEGMRAVTGTVGGISVDKSLLFTRDETGRATGTNTLVAEAHAAGLEVYCWTLRPENRYLESVFRRGEDPAAHGAWREEFLAILATGVDGVFADQPELAIEARAALLGDPRP